MTSVLATRQGTLTRAGNRLSALLKEHGELLDIHLDTVARVEERELRKQIRKARATFSHEANKVEEALIKYSSAVDDLPDTTPARAEIFKRSEEHVEAAQSLLDRTQTALSKLLMLQEELEEPQEESRPLTMAAEEIKLAPIPLPKFSGNIWEWESFWKSFEHNVHSKRIDDIHKFNYLLEALEGEAKETTKQFQVSGSTYSLIIAHLHEKYGDAQALVEKLLHRLQTLRAKSDRLEDQLALCEQLCSITSQLDLKGEHINNAFLQKQLLSKLSADVQRHVLKQKPKKEADGTWSTKTLLSLVKEYTKDELKIIEQVEPRQLRAPKQTKPGAPFRKEQVTKTPKVTGPQCFYCEKTGHPAKGCTEVTTAKERHHIMKTKRLCRNCGKQGHTAQECAGGACRGCGILGHHTSICPKLFPEETSLVSKKEKLGKKVQTKASRTSAKVNSVSSAQEPQEDQKVDTVLHINNHADVLILAGQAQVINPVTQELEAVHVMLDTGADRSFISNDLADRLHLQNISSKRLTISTFGSPTPMVKTCGVTVLKIWDAQGVPHTFQVTKIDTVTGTLQRSSLSLEDKRFLCDNDLQLSILPTTSDIRPQILLGCADLFSLLDNGLAPQYVLPSGLQLIPSRLGYLVAGRTSESSEIEKELTHEATVHTTSSTILDENPQSWEDFCIFESSGVHEFTGPKEEERKRTDEAVWKRFEQTIERKNDGYWVRFPWRDNARTLPDNKCIAVRRLQALMTKLNEEPEVCQKYQETLQDQLSQGIIEEIDEMQTPDGEIVHYLPHRAVITPHKSTTKLRIVFDASAHKRDSPSLNDVLHRGPVLLPKLCDILLRFRIGKVALTSDVEKAFLQVRLHIRDRDATRFLWLRRTREPVSQSNLIVYRFSRVTFGLICSPFLLAATIKYHLQHNARNRAIAREIDENTYVDNVVLTTQSSEEATTLYRESKEIFTEMKMNLREFISNDDNVKKHIAEKDLSDNSTQKILGVLWNSKDDQLCLTCKYPPREKITKRTVSEQVASVYDPLGWLTPITLHGKTFLQQLWKCDYSWDTELSQEHQQQWNGIVRSVDGFQWSIRRRVAQIKEPVQIIVFSDASSCAMASCAYLATASESHLIAAKSKLPSIKEKPTIPKLELNAVTIAVRLAYTLYEATKERLTISKVVILSDSEITLSWLATYPVDPSVGVLVRNRVCEIRRILGAVQIPVWFGYVHSSENPADCATRGLDKREFEDHIWWTGPAYISHATESWPRAHNLFRLPDTGQNEDGCVLTATTADSPSELLELKRQRSLPRCQRVVAYMLRFVRKLLSRVNPSLQERVKKAIPELRSEEVLPYITASERENALRVIIRNHQVIHLPPDRQRALKQLKLENDAHGILRCRGRLGKSCLPFDAKYPCLIASKTDLARLVVEEAHLPLHCGIGHTMAIVRERFWIMKLRQLVRTVLTRCVPCQKVNNLPYRYPEMNDLPERRVQRTRPFEHVGIDYFGPLSVKKGEDVAKMYGIILTCTTTRLVHLELVPDMSTQHLLFALRRFFARRGIPASITSDNGPNFLLGEQVLRSAVFPVINDVSHAQAMAEKGIVWKTITPYAPWQGALYERLIKSVKHSLYKVMQRNVPEREMLETLLVEIEGSVNSRPLTYQEERWEETPILRPIDFIQRDLVISYPFETIGNEEEDGSYLPPSEAVLLRTRQQTEDALKKSHQLTERFWTIWNKQYLTSLRETHKLQVDHKRSTPKTPKVGDVVLIAEAVIPRNEWKMGRITRVNPAQSGVIRDVELQTPNRRTIRRPVNLLVPLEIGDSSCSDSRNMTPTPPTENEEHSHGTGEGQGGRYNLRPRTRKSNGAALVNFTKNTVTTIMVLMACLFLPRSVDAEFITHSSKMAKGTMRCLPGGIQLTSENILRYELCAEEQCQVRDNPKTNETIHLPPEITLHPYHVQWKFFNGNELAVLEIICPSVSFCENVHCWFCTANVFNPECSPRRAITVIATLLYIVIAAIYLFCYVPIVVGKPIRIFTKILWSCAKGVITVTVKLWRIFRITRHRNRPDVEALLRAPVIAASLASVIIAVHGCRNIDVFTQQTTVCSFSTGGQKECSFETIHNLKLNSLEQTSCIRLVHNQSLVEELHFRWKKLQLNCVKEDVSFTRNTVQRVIDSKRCAHTGSCVKEKCASINETTLVPELEKGNGYPGVTRCVESCGGPGCGCFYLSSGCLFYRIYNVPDDNRIYEIFVCRQWEEQLEVEVTRMGRPDKGVRRKRIALKPTIPVQLGGVRITLNAVTMPPTPELSSTFISNGVQLALWRRERKPSLVCESREAAETLNCSVATNCRCEPAENTVNCMCADLNITKIFETEVENRLPARRPWITFVASRNDPTTVSATVPSFLTAELLVHLKDQFDKTIVRTTNARCKVEDAVVQGCYNCPQGAVANISCYSDQNDVMATIRCEEHFFTVPCQRDGAASSLAFNFKTARIQMTCEVSCGHKSTSFELTGILQWVRTIHGTVSRLVKGQSRVYEELVFPDFFHIADVMLSWYKTVLAVSVGFILALVVGYVVFWTCGLRVIARILQIIFRIVIGVMKLVVWIPTQIIQTLCGRARRQTTAKLEKLL